MVTGNKNKAEALAEFFINVVQYLLISQNDWNVYIRVMNNLLMALKLEKQSTSKATLTDILICVQDILNVDHIVRKYIIDVISDSYMHCR